MTVQEPTEAEIAAMRDMLSAKVALDYADEEAARSDRATRDAMEAQASAWQNYADAIKAWRLASTGTNPKPLRLPPLLPDPVVPDFPAHIPLMCRIRGHNWRDSNSGGRVRQTCPRCRHL